MGWGGVCKFCQVFSCWQAVAPQLSILLLLYVSALYHGLVNTNVITACSSSLNLHLEGNSQQLCLYISTKDKTGSQASGCANALVFKQGIWAKQDLGLRWSQEKHRSFFSGPLCIEGAGAWMLPPSPCPPQSGVHRSQTLRRSIGGQWPPFLYFLNPMHLNRYLIRTLAWYGSHPGPNHKNGYKDAERKMTLESVAQPKMQGKGLDSSPAILLSKEVLEERVHTVRTPARNDGTLKGRHWGWCNRGICLRCEPSYQKWNAEVLGLGSISYFLGLREEGCEPSPETGEPGSLGRDVGFYRGSSLCQLHPGWKGYKGINCRSPLLLGLFTMPLTSQAQQGCGWQRSLPM